MVYVADVVSMVCGARGVHLGFVWHVVAYTCMVRVFKLTPRFGTLFFDMHLWRSFVFTFRSSVFAFVMEFWTSDRKVSESQHQFQRRVPYDCMVCEMNNRWEIT